MVKDPARTAQSLRAIHALGVKLLVDDFGTGYTSLSMLHQMDFDSIKVYGAHGAPRAEKQAML